MLLQQLNRMVCLLGLSLTPGVTTAAAHPLEGSWRLESGVIYQNGQATEYAAVRMKSIKVVAGNHFSFVSHKDNQFYAAAAGRVRIEQDQYIEVPEFASYPPLIGEKFQFKFQLQQDRWLNERYEAGQLVEREVWRRLP
jgi:hypothetical protein